MEINKAEDFVLQKLIEGDESAFKYFFDNYYDDLCNFINLYVNDGQLSEDIVQSIFIDVWERREKLLANKSLKTYLYSAVKNKGLNHLRDKKNKARIEAEILKDVEENDPYTNDFFDSKDLQNLIKQSIESLPEKCRQIFKLSREQELSNAEVASQLNISVKTVENQMTIAFRKMRDSLKPHYDKIFLLFLFSTFY